MYMQSRTIILVVILLGAIVAGMFTYTFLAKEATAPSPEDTADTDTQNVDTYGITRIDAKHFYIDGVHTIVGEVPMPTPCDLLTYDSRVAESHPEQVTFAFGVKNDADTCAQVVTIQRFMVSATASNQATLQATFNGQPIELNLIEAEPGETPDDFELYIKG